MASTCKKVNTGMQNAWQEKAAPKEKVKHECPAHLVANSKTPLRASCIDFWVRKSGVVDRSTKRRRFGGDSDKNKIDVHNAENIERSGKSDIVNAINSKTHKGLNLLGKKKYYSLRHGERTINNI